MIGREKELNHLYSLYESDHFEYLVMYGRRRVGKTTLLHEFSKNTKTILYPAKEKNDALNLEDFSMAIQLHFDKSFIAPFSSWEAAFDYIYHKVDEKTAIIIDEFPYIVKENPAIKSILQHAIDYKFKNKKIFLILCGSSVSIMENEVMGSKSPLHDRQTSSLEIKPFDYLESCSFFPDYTNEEKLISYGILGGIPRYLEAFDPKKDIKTNIAKNIIKEGSYLHEEVHNLLKAELREVNVYNSILLAIASGRNRIGLIADYIHEDKAKVSKYLITLQLIRLVEKIVPCGESDESRKSIYVIKDNFFKFYFRYQFGGSIYFEILGEDEAANEIMADISNHMGLVFEDIAKEYLIKEAKKRRLPFIPYYIGKWWGNNPYIKAQDDVDVLVMDKSKTKAIFMECKFTSAPMDYCEYEDLVNATKAFLNIKEKYLYFLSRSGYTDSVKEKAAKDKATLLGIDDLFID